MLAGARTLATGSHPGSSLLAMCKASCKQDNCIEVQGPQELSGDASQVPTLKWRRPAELLSSTPEATTSSHHCPTSASQGLPGLRPGLPAAGACLSAGACLPERRASLPAHRVSWAPCTPTQPACPGTCRAAS